MCIEKITCTDASMLPVKVCATMATVALRMLSQYIGHHHAYRFNSILFVLFDMNL